MGFIISLFVITIATVITVVCLQASAKKKIESSGIKVGSEVKLTGIYKDKHIYKVEKINSFGGCTLKKVDAKFFKNSTKYLNISYLKKYNPPAKNEPAPTQIVYNTYTTVVEAKEEKKTKVLPFVSCPCCGGKFEEKEIDFSKSIFKCEYCDSIFSFNTK